MSDRRMVGMKGFQWRTTLHLREMITKGCFLDRNGKATEIIEMWPAVRVGKVRLERATSGMYLKSEEKQQKQQINEIRYTRGPAGPRGLPSIIFISIPIPEKLATCGVTWNSGYEGD